MVFIGPDKSSVPSRKTMKTHHSSMRSSDRFLSVSSIRAPLKPVRLHFEDVKKDETPKPRKRAEASEDDVDFQKHFGGETCFDDNESTWLSADGSSPSSFFDEYRLSGILGSHHLFDDRLVFWLSRLQKDQSVTSPRKDGDFKKIEGDTTSTEFEEEPERASLTSSNSSRLSTTRNDIGSHDNTAVEVPDQEKLGLIASLMNLDRQDSLEDPGYDFSSPSYPSSGRSETQTWTPVDSSFPESNSVASISSYSSPNVSENEEWESCVGKPEPIFWPFEGKFDWNLEEAMEFLRMSPRKEVIEKVGSHILPVKSVLINRKFDPKQRHLRRLRRSESKTEKSCDMKPETGKVNSKTISNKRPSRLSKNSKNFAKIVPVEDEACVKQPENSNLEKSSVRNMKLEKWRSMDEESIESIIGLDEFDGHEGMDAELDRNDELFSHFLLQSPR